MEEFQLTIKTNDRYYSAGTIATVCVKIVGADGKSTKWNTLDYFFKNDFQKGSIESYTVYNNDEEVGQPVMLHFKLKGLTTDAWLCDDIIVEHKGFEYAFPVYDWLEDELVILRGEATLPQKVTNDHIRAARKAEVERNREIFRWQQRATSEDEIGWGVPRFIDSERDLPMILRETMAKSIQNKETSWKTTLNELRNRFRGLFRKLQSPADYKRLYKNIGVDDPKFIAKWRRDEEVGRQMLSGVSPLDIEMCKVIPEYCQISGEHVDCLLPDGCTLTTEIQKGRVYMADYTDGIKVKRNLNPQTGSTYFHADCVAFFYSSPINGFRPIAIQLIPHDDDSICTPVDAEYDWLLAKMFMRSASLSFHQGKHRFLNTNLVSETFCVALMRNLPHCHPVYKLLRPHLRTVAHVNREARNDDVSEDSDINKCISLNTISLMRKSFQSFHLDNLNIPKVLEKKGLLNSNLLPNFHYRDDVMELWKVVQTYAGDVIRHFYECDEDVKRDMELQEWTLDVATEGFGWQDGNTRGAPEHIDSADELIHLCTLIIFTSSVQHSLLSHGQMESYQFVPNAPCAMRMTVHNKGQGTLERIMETLPDIKAANTMISYSYGMSKFAKDEVFLGETLESLFVEDSVRETLTSFKRSLDELGAKFRKRNEELEYPYIASQPGNIPRSIVN